MPMWRRFPWVPEAVSKNLSLSFDVAAILFRSFLFFCSSLWFIDTRLLLCHGYLSHNRWRVLSSTTESLRINWRKPTRGCDSWKWFLLKHCWSLFHTLWSSFDSLIAFTQPTNPLCCCQIVLLGFCVLTICDTHRRGSIPDVWQQME